MNLKINHRTPVSAALKSSLTCLKVRRIRLISTVQGVAKIIGDGHRFEVVRGEKEKLVHEA